MSCPFHNGVRDVSMGSGPIRLANDDELRAGIKAAGWELAHETALTKLQRRASRVYLHIDLDSMDIDDARATERLTIAGAAITAYDPAFDPDDRTLGAARAVAREIARGVRPQPTPDTV